MNKTNIILIALMGIFAVLIIGLSGCNQIQPICGDSSCGVGEELTCSSDCGNIIQPLECKYDSDCKSGEKCMNNICTDEKVSENVQGFGNFTPIVVVNVVNGTTLSIKTSSLPSGNVGIAYSSNIEAGLISSADYSWSATGLPHDLTLVPNTSAMSRNKADIIGTPNTAGTYNVIVTVSAGNQTNSKQFSLVIATSTTTTGCYNNSIYLFDENGNRLDLVRKCGLISDYWPHNGFCHETSDGKTEKLMYPSYYESNCYTVDGDTSCVKSTKYLESTKSRQYQFTNRQELANSNGYFYVGEPVAGTERWGFITKYVDPTHPNIINVLETSGTCITTNCSIKESCLLWDNGMLVLNPHSDPTIQPPARIVSDLISFYQANNILPFHYSGNSMVCEGEINKIEDSCKDPNTSILNNVSYRYNGKCEQHFLNYARRPDDLVSARCLLEDTPYKTEQYRQTICPSGTVCYMDDTPYFGCFYWPSIDMFKAQTYNYRMAYVHMIKYTDYTNCKPSLDLDAGEPICCNDGGCAQGGKCYPGGFITQLDHIGPIDSPKFGNMSARYVCNASINSWVLVDSVNV